MALVTTDPSFCFILQSHLYKRSPRSPLPSFGRRLCSKAEAAGPRRGTVPVPRVAEMASGGRALPTARHRQAPLGPVGTVWCGTVP